MLNRTIISILSAAVLAVLPACHAMKAEKSKTLEEWIASCLPDRENIAYQVIANINDPDAVKDENPKRPLTYVQYLATNKLGGKWLGLVMISKDNQCTNPVPDDSYKNYEQYAPFEIAVQLEMKNQKLLLQKHKEIEARIAAGDPPKGDLYVSDEVAEEQFKELGIPCEVKASTAEALSRMGNPMKNCTVLEQEKPQW